MTLNKWMFTGQYRKELKQREALQKQPPEVCSKKEGVLKKIAIFTGKHACWVFFNKVGGVANLSNRDFNIGTFLWIMWNFLENLFWTTFGNGMVETKMSSTTKNWSAILFWSYFAKYKMLWRTSPCEQIPAQV